MRFFGYLLIFFISFPGLIATGQEPQEALPKVLQHEQPIYPPLARTARLEGEVHLKITTDGESVSNVEVESGHPLLTKAAEENVRTWKFVKHSPSEFHVTFRYKLISGYLYVCFLERADIVEIAAAPPTLNVDYATVKLGAWRAQLDSSHGRISRVFKLASGGSEGKQLQVETLNPASEAEKIVFGYLDDGLLDFEITLTQPHRRHVRTLLIGKLEGTGIIGTFVDDAGVRGQWTAVRIGRPPVTKP